MTRETDAIARAVDDVVRSVPGVAALYSAAPSLARSARELGTGPAALSVVGSDAAGMVIETSVGVTGERQARVTAQAVSEAIREAVIGGPAEGASVHVRVSRVTG